MCVDALGHSFKAVPEDEFDDGAVDVGRVKHTGKRVAAFVRRMRHAKVAHDWVKDGPSERVVAVTRPVAPRADVVSLSLHGILVPRYESLGDGDEPPASCLGLAVPDDDDTAPQLDVGLTYVTILTNSTAGKDKHEYMTYFWHLIDPTP